MDGEIDELSPERREAERNYMISLGQRIREVREQRRLTQKEAAAAAGIATDMISRLENGRYLSPGLRTLFRIASGLGTSISTLLPENEAHLSTDLQERLHLLCQSANERDLALIVGLAQVVVDQGINNNAITCGLNPSTRPS